MGRDLGRWVNSLWSKFYIIHMSKKVPGKNIPPNIKMSKKISSIFLKELLHYLCVYVYASKPPTWILQLFQKLKPPLYFEKILVLVGWPCAEDFGAFSRDILPVEISDRRLWQIKRNIHNKLGQKEPVIYYSQNYS